MRAWIAGLSLLLCAGALGQERFPMDRRDGDAIFAEAVALPGRDSTQVRIDLHLKIDYAFFVPVRDVQAEGAPVFARRGEVLVELQDSLGRSLARTMQTIEIADEISERDLERRAWHQITVSLEAPPGRHRFLIEVEDNESDRKLVNKGTAIEATKGAPLGPGSWVVLEGDGPPADDRQVWLQNVGGEILFGHQTSLLLRLPPGDATTVDAELSIRLDGDGDHMRVVASDSLQELPVQTPVTLEPVAGADRVGYRLRADSSSEGRFVIIPLPTASLPLRRYALTLLVRDGAEEMRAEMKFRTLWPQMPFSLRDVDVALAALRYIVPEETLDSLQSGSFQERRRNLEEFWRARDQTPGTIENEVMTQYYRRVDYARQRFGTIRQPDGFRSDRGRIYVLLGKPTTTERDLDPQAGFREIWTYSHLGKRFVFEDRGKTGNYVLTATDAQ